MAPAARRGNETVRKPRIVRFLTCPPVHARAPPSASRTESGRRGTKAEAGRQAKEEDAAVSSVAPCYRRREWKRNGPAKEATACEN